MARLTPAQRFGRRVGIARRTLKLTQQEVANKTGLTTATISRLESGNLHNPNLTTMLAISKALKVSLSQLVEGL